MFEPRSNAKCGCNSAGLCTTFIDMHVRREQISDCDSIRDIIRAAFADNPHSQHNEQSIVAKLRAANALTVSLVAVDGAEIVGHVACSPVWINNKKSNWFGLGPVAVRPDRQGHGIGAMLVRASIERLKSFNAEGIVLLGEPAYYGRFGFTAQSELKLPGAPASYFLCLSLGGDIASGVVSYHAAFSA
jgi:putative acetyltransferase